MHCLEHKKFYPYEGNQQIDSKIGISLYTTKFSGIGGKIRIYPEDFEVSELISKRATNSITDESGYAVYKLQKKKIDTNHALSGVDE